MMDPQHFSRTRPFQRRWLYWGLVLSGWILLASCDTTPLMSPPLVDKQRFTPLPQSQRVIVKPKVKYLVRPDGYEFCARITGIKMTLGTRVMACAYWNVRRRECTIVTPLKTGYNYVGHELRHCFEGAFHD